MEAVGYLISEALGRLGIPQSELARRLGVSRSAVNAVILSARQSAAATVHKVPKEDAAKWADALEMQGTERDHFLELVWLSHAPPEIAVRLDILRRELADSRAEVTKLREQDRLLRDEMTLIRDELRRRGIKLREHG